MATNQTSTNSYLAKILCENIPFTYNRIDTGVEETIYLSRMFSTIFPFSLKISLPPHQPLTFLEFAGYGFGRIGYSSNYFSMDDFTALVAAGYFVMTNDLNSAPFCMRDVTCGISVGQIEIMGILSKIDPVLHYAKDIWYATRPFIGKFNVVDDVISVVHLVFLLDVINEVTGD